jgi:surface carbohydrate biosynthesis protein
LLLGIDGVGLVTTRRIEVSPRRWILLPIGFALKAREFDGNALLAFEAAERGWGVILGRKAVRYNTKLPRGMLIEKNIAPGTAAKMATPLSMGRKLSACCEEGLVYARAEEYGRRKIERECYHLLENFFCWGRHQAHDMVDKIGCNRDKISVTGNPRFDLHRAELRAVFADRVERIRRKFSPYILINTKFSQHNGYFTRGAALEKMKELGTVKTAEQEAEARGLAAFHKGGFEKFLELIEELSRRFPDYTIVVRPHPSERHDPWKAKAATLPNVEVICEGNVAEWILGSELCIHNNCTTGVETYLLGKTAISYRPVCDPRFDLFLPNALSAEAFDLEQVIDLASRTLRCDEISTARDAASKAELAQYFLANFEGKLGCVRMVDALDSADLPEEPLSFSAGLLNDLRVTTRTGIRGLKRVLNGSEFTALRQDHALRQDDVRGADVVEFLIAAQKVTGRFSNVQVAQLEKNLICIH